MKPFTPVTNPVHADFFSLYTNPENNKRYIHIHGYTYKSDNMDYVSEDNPNGIYWANTECIWLIVELDDFVDTYRERGGEFIDELFQDAKQGQRDLTPAEMVDAINNYYGIAPDAILDYGEITMDTPDGNYMTSY